MDHEMFCTSHATHDPMYYDPATIIIMPMNADLAHKRA